MSVSERVKKFIQDNFYVSDPGQLAEGASLITGGLVDSTGMLEVIGFLESEFGIRVLDEEMVPDNLESIGQIAAYVARKQGPAAV